MHEPLSRHWRLKDKPNARLALARACAFVAILAVVLVGLAAVVGEFTIGRRDQASAIAIQTMGNAHGARDAAPSTNDLFSGMPLP